MYRTLRAADLEAALALSTAAGWNQVAADWERILQLEPEGCFVVEAEGRIAATATAIRYGRELAWIGMVLTDPAFRRRGFATMLLQAAIRHASSVRGIMLDATDQGRPLYASLGFRDDQPIERWQREGIAGEAIPPGEPVAIPIELDREAFGADRSHLLPLLSEGGSASREGYGLRRPGLRARYLGPCVARDTASARAAIVSCLEAAPGEPWYWDLLPRNAEAVALARGLGFVPARRLTRMVLGEIPQRRDDLVYAVAGLEYG